MDGSLTYASSITKPGWKKQGRTEGAAAPRRVAVGRSHVARGGATERKGPVRSDPSAYRTSALDQRARRLVLRDNDVPSCGRSPARRPVCLLKDCTPAGSDEQQKIPGQAHCTLLPAAKCTTHPWLRGTSLGLFACLQDTYDVVRGP